MRYEAKRIPGDSDHWYVQDNLVASRRIGLNRYGPWLTSGEAHVIEFSLNAVVDGDMLAKDWGLKDVFDPTKMEYYSGPTDGLIHADN